MDVLWSVNVVIELKPTIRDPEGETILRDLLHKGGKVFVQDVRAGKFLRFKVRAESKDEALALVRNVCDELRLYNPVAHVCKVWSDD